MDDIRIWYVGEKSAVWQIVDLWKQYPNVPPKQLEGRLSTTGGNYAAIMEDGDKVLGVVDKIRSYPIFYFQKGSEFAISNSARKLREELDLDEIDDMSLLEFCMAAYVTGRETLYKDLYQIQAGEYVFWNQTIESLCRKRYYLFLGKKYREDDEEELIEELDERTNRVFLRVIEQTKGDPIWVALSGGLDSRLVLCKLKQIGCQELRAFSYGAPGNYEAKIAKEVAEKVGVEWCFVPLGMREARRFFHSEERRKYWSFADGLSVVPNMQDIAPLLKLFAGKKLQESSVIVNGQSGDFITGGHIPAYFLDGGKDLSLLFRRAIEKHYSQWLSLLSQENIGRVTNKIRAAIGAPEGEKIDGQRLSSLYELWEWQERQCKYVINGQRIYDYLGLKWILPLWDDDYLTYWEEIPLNMKFSQRLYKRYLEKYDFFGCFRNFKREVWRWPGVTIAVVPVARMVRVLFGRKCSEMFYHYFKYIGHYRHFYAPYGLRNYVKFASKIRGSVALDIDTWINENLNQRIFG
ncbi:MAG: asparagine synthase [Deltaproteobacteria bacterium]|nr:asparagine synthase [Deltaproteobacteria bacterium]